MTTQRIGVVAVGRETFDLASSAPLVREIVASLEMQARLAGHGAELIGDGTVLTSADRIEAVTSRWPEVTGLVIVFASFTDASLAAAAVRRLPERSPTLLWSLPERWEGGRLRWNSLCGANLAAHLLVGRAHPVTSVHSLAAGRPAAWALRWLAEPGARVWSGSSRATGNGAAGSEPVGERSLGSVDGDAVTRTVARLSQLRLGVLGAPPTGFEPCEVPDDGLPFGGRADHHPIDDLFEAADGELAAMTDAVADGVATLARVESSAAIGPEEIRKSAALEAGLANLAGEGRWDAVAVRCWPECFDVWGGAACAAMSAANESGLPASCECDALGAITMVMLDELGGGPTFLADVVDADLDRGELALWHCGVAPRTMADASRPVRVALHPNRGVPAVLDFGLRSGRVTLARLSQSGGSIRLAVGTACVLDREHPFTGTSGVLAPDRPVAELLGTIFAEGLEHHLVVAHGDWRLELEAVAEALELPVVELT